MEPEPADSSANVYGMLNDCVPCGRLGGRGVTVIGPITIAVLPAGTANVAIEPEFCTDSALAATRCTGR